MAGYGFYRTETSLSVCLSALYLKTYAARITRLDKQRFHGESRKPIYFGIKRSKVTITSHSMGVCTLVSAGFFRLPHAITLVSTINNLSLKLCRIRVKYFYFYVFFVILRQYYFSAWRTSLPHPDTHTSTVIMCITNTSIRNALSRLYARHDHKTMTPER